ncbi:MAG: hypothetical protein AAF721_04585 [Myxococcota bacterium]
MGRWWSVAGAFAVGCATSADPDPGSQMSIGFPDENAASTGGASAETLDGELGDATFTQVDEDTANADESSGDMPAPGTCGDGVVDAGEQCDDGNASDLDACLANCQLASCDDGFHSGDESDVDCGGSCPGLCAACDGCQSAADCSAGLSCEDGRCAASASMSVSYANDCHGDTAFGEETLRALPAGHYRATARPSGGTEFPPPWDPPESGWVWIVRCGGFEPTMMRTPGGNLYVNADAAFSALISETEEFDHPGGDFTCWIDDGNCENNSGSVDFDVALVCD